MADLEIIFKTVAQLEGAKQTLDAIQKTVAASKDLNHQGQLKGAVGEINGVIDEVSKGLGELIPGLGSLGPSAMAGLAPIAAGFAAIAAGVHFAVESLKEFATAELNVVARDAALANHGRLIEEVRTEYSQLAAETAEATGTLGEEWTKVIATLTKFGASTGTIHEATEGVKNLAGFLGGDLEGAATAVGKALNGNFTLLERYGIQVDHNKSKAENLAEIWEQLAQRGGGQLEARLNTMAGRTKAVSNAWTEFKESVGNSIARLGMVQEGLRIFAGGLEQTAKLFPQAIEQNSALTNKLEGVASAGNDAGSGMGAAAEGATKLKGAAEQATEALKKEIGALQDARRLSDALLDAKTSGKLAEVDIAEAEGKLSPAHAEAERSKIRTAAEIAKTGSENLEAIQVEGAIKKKREEAQKKLDAAGTEADSVQGEFEATAKKYGLQPDRGYLDTAFAAAQSGLKVAKTPEQRAEVEEKINQIREVNDLGNLAKQRDKEYDEAKKDAEGVFGSTAPDLRSAQIARAGSAAKLGSLQTRRRADEAVGAKRIQTEAEQNAQRDQSEADRRHADEQRSINEYLKTGIGTAATKHQAALAENSQIVIGALRAQEQAQKAENEKLRRDITTLQSQVANRR